MRIIQFHLPVLLALAAAAPCAAQAIIVPLRCSDECAPERLPRTVALDSVGVWVNSEPGGFRTMVNHVFHNETSDTLDAAFFFPLPADATIQSVGMYDQKVVAHDRHNLLHHGAWSLPQEARWILAGLMRERPRAGLDEYAVGELLHVPLRAIPPGARWMVQVQYSQPQRMEGGEIAYRYPLSTGAAASPIGDLRMGLTIRTEAGFASVGSPSHAVEVRWGLEPGPCRPQERCGTRGYPSERVRVIRLQPRADDRRRDFRVVYTPREAPANWRRVSNR